MYVKNTFRCTFFMIKAHSFSNPDIYIDLKFFLYLQITLLFMVKTHYIPCIQVLRSFL